MTTIDAAAASQLRRRLALAALATLVASGLGACGTSNSLLGSGEGDAPTLAQQATTQPAAAQSRISIAPVIGAPEAVAKQLTGQLTQELEKNKILVAKAPTDRYDYTLRGYVVAAREKVGVKVSYIWDVTDPTGKRVHRITGEEVASGGDARDPWAAVTPTVTQAISSKTAVWLGAWLPSQSQAAVASGGAVAGSVQTAAATSGRASDAAPGTASSGAQATAALPAPTTGSLGRDGAVSAIVPSVTGAPGDGETSLTSALRRELQRSGVAVSERGTGGTYRVEGKVRLGQSKSGKQPIQIDWHVTDPQGKEVGKVSQKNEILEGSLDGSWGKVADDAAHAAAQGILKLLPAKSAIN